MAKDRRMTPEEFLAAEAAWEEDVTAARSAWHTPRPAVDAIVVRVTGRSPDALERLHSGQSNETYVCDAGATRLIIRVGREGAAHFERERWAIEAARGRGVPTPEVLLIAEDEIGGEVVSFCVERFLPGLPLGKLARRRGRMDALVARAVRNAGVLLAAIHEVRTSGFGALRPDGTAPFGDWAAFLAERLGPLPGEVPPEVTAAVAALDDHRAVLCATEPHLLHFDFEPSHVLVNEDTGAVTGVVDLEEAKSGDPAYEFAQWDVIHDAYAPVAPLALGYAERAAPSANFALRRLLSEIHFRARQLAHASVASAHVPAARRRLALTLNVLG
jgi:aminoglycoside phosphotransferase (APT) family kinase protein